MIGRWRDASTRLRLDINNLGTAAAEFSRYVNALGAEVFAIEEPLQAGALEGFREVGRVCDAKIILDESILRVEQVDALHDPEAWIVNLRVSKLEGMLRSLAVADKAAERGIGIIVGAQVGETSLLTRADLSLMQAERKMLMASEGAFGTHLLARDLTEPCLMFGADGTLATGEWRALSRPGLGLDVSASLFSTPRPPPCTPPT